MAFFGKTFTYQDINGKNIPSELYNLYISSPDGGDVETSGSSQLGLYTEAIYRRPLPYLYGVSQNTVLQFPVSINAPYELTAHEATLVQKWLFGSMNYRKLWIMQDDMQDVYFNCILNNPKIKRNGNKIIGFNCEVICDSPFAWTNNKTLTKSYITVDVVDSFAFNNRTDNSYYTYPTIQVTMNSSGGDFSIVNASDNSREFLFEGLSPDEVVTINNDLGIITSSTGLKRLSNFNKNFFRLVQGTNNLTITGRPLSVVFTYKLAKKIGG